MRLLYDVCHNIAKIETFTVDERQVKLCVHRKGATRAFPPGHPSLPERYLKVGQPVLIPGIWGQVLMSWWVQRRHLKILSEVHVMAPGG